MKKIIAGLGLILWLLPATQAQTFPGKKRPMQRGQHFLWRQQLLSEEQQKKYRSLQQNYRKNLMELQKKDDITVKEWRNRMEELQQKHREELRSLFTPQQKERMERMKMHRNRLMMRMQWLQRHNENQNRLYHHRPPVIPGWRYRLMPQNHHRIMERMKMYRFNKPGTLS